MKIGIVTVPDSSNCGSFLQAYGMKIFLESQGHEVEFIRTRDKKYIKNLFYNNELLIKSLIKYPIIGIKRWMYWKKEYQVFSQEWQDYFVIKNAKLHEYDLIVLGSDEIWNIRTPIFQNELFFGAQCKNVIAYAVSAGRATIDDFKRYSNLQDCLFNINDIFVRDSNTQNIVKSLTGQTVPCVCDPTLLIDRTNYHTQLSKTLQGKKYMVLYAYSISKNLRKHIIKYSKENNLLIVSVGFFYIWADQNINCRPLELFSILKNATVVYTETFHGTIFSVLSKSRFISTPTGSISKVSDFLSHVELQNHMASPDLDYNRFCSILDSNIDYDAVNLKLEEFKNQSKAYFSKALEQYNK